MKTHLTIIVACAVSIASGAEAGAHDRRLLVRPPAFDDGSVGTPVDALPTPFSNGGSCVKDCDEDFTPCDPSYWKVADRRCNINQRG